jgi:Domain of unknown function (DUF4440)
VRADQPKKWIMKKELIFLCVALIAPSTMCLAQTSPEPSAAPAADATMITDLEGSAWYAYKNKQTRSLKKLLSKSYYGVYAEGIKSLDMEVADMGKTDLHNYSFANIKVEFPNANVAIITYKATQQATSDGKDLSGTYYNESVWVKKGDKWLNAFHTEIKTK